MAPSSMLEDGGRPMALDWMSHLRTSLPPIDFGPSNDGGAASPYPSPYARHGTASYEKRVDSSSLRKQQTASRSAPQRKERAQHDVDAWPEYKHAIGSGSAVIDDSPPVVHEPSHQRRDDLVCWEHGCNGRVFTTSSNLARHRREHSDKRPTYHCPKCGAFFSRKTARNTHIENDSCQRIRRYSNGRERPKLRK